jgi:hypothetical protein
MQMSGQQKLSRALPDQNCVCISHTPHAGFIPDRVLKAIDHEDWGDRSTSNLHPRKVKWGKLPSAFGTQTDNTYLTHHTVFDF